MDKKTTKNILLIIFLSISFIFILWHIDTVLSLISKLLSILRPVIIGFAIAFILKGIKNSLENLFAKLMKKNKSGKKVAAALSTVCVYIILGLFIVSVVLIVIPQLVDSINLFKDNFDGYVANAQNYIKNLAAKYDSEFLSGLDIKTKINELIAKASELIPYIIKGTLGITTTIVGTTTDIIIGVIFSVYFLFNKDKLYGQIKKTILAFLSKKKAEKTLAFLEKANHSFSNFVKGQLTEAFILGSLCFIGMTIFRFEYAFLISVLVGVTSLIPIVGAFIGTIPGVFILFLIDPMKAVWFVVFIIVLQQIEGNLIYPRVVGTNVGLPALWVLFAITIGGGLYGVLGMILSVPIMSLIHDGLKEKVNKRLSE